MFLKENMVTREDVQAIVQKSIDPIAKDVGQVRAHLSRHDDDIEDLRSEFGKLKANLGSSKKSKLDFSALQVAFVGFNETMTADERIREIDQICQKVTEVKPVVMDNFYKGPMNARVLSPAGFAQFHSEDAVKRFLDQLPSKKFQVRGMNINVKRAMPPEFKERNWVLSEVEKLLKREAGKGATILADFAGKERRIKVNGKLAFQQNKEGSSGIFHAPYSHLTVPR